MSDEINLVNIYSYGHFSFKTRNERESTDAFLFRVKRDAVAKTINLKNPKVAEHLIFAALEHFGDDFSLWVNHNIKRNPYINDENVKFIFQFLEYIKTGEFKPGINAWSWIMKKTKHDRFSIEPARKIFDYSTTGLPVYTTEVLKLIISNSEDGIFHLLDIMNILFGKTDAIVDTVSVKVDY